MSKLEIYAVAGKPILHSKSPNIFNSEFKSSNTNAIYTRMAADSAEEILFLAKEIGIKGLNITAPFKEELLPLIDKIDIHSGRIGAINTIKLENSQFYGTNTDYLGVINSLKNEIISLKDKNVVVLGAGGAAKAAIYGLKSENALITIVNRTVEKGESLASEFDVNFKPINELNTVLRKADIFVSTLPFTLESITTDSLLNKPVVLDANYKNSTLLEMANEVGCTTIDGLQWLYLQAIEGYKFMLGKNPNLVGLKKGIDFKKANSQTENICLCGFMASGKTLIGKSLSKLSGLTFVDCDDEIEKNEKLTIAQIFEKHGEDYFRKLEEKIVKKILNENKQLVSLGGGAILSTENRKTIHQKSKSIWLYSSIDSTVNRIKDTSRPLLNGENVKEKAENTLNSRLPFYAKTSDLIVNTTDANGKNLNNFAKRILFELENNFETKKIIKDSIEIYPSKLNGEIISPTSKSFTQRMIAIGTLAKGVTTISNPTYCNDVVAALEVAKSMGLTIKVNVDKIELINKNNSTFNSFYLNCNEAGLSLRMFSAIASLYDKKLTLTGSGSLLSRPISMIESPLRQLGVEINSNNGFLPIELKGPMKGGKVIVDGSTSSQFLTGLLISLPLLKQDSEITVENLKSKPYIDLTLDLMKKANVNVTHSDYKIFSIEGNQKYNAIKVKAEGDWSSAAMLIVAGAVSGEIKIKGLNFNSCQGDIQILEAVKKTGAEINIDKDSVSIKTREQLNSFHFDATDCPDLFPPLVALAANCTGASEIKGVHRLKHKESNRAKTLQQEFKKLNIKIELIEDKMTIHGGEISGGIVHSNNDHRIGMALGIAALNAKSKVVVNNQSCISKSYPDFFKHLQLLGGMINE